MSKKSLETALPVPIDRSMSPKLGMAMGETLEASGVVDYYHVWDQLQGFAPRALWTPDVTSLADVVGDPDSFPDPIVAAAYGVANTDELGVMVSTDAVRRGPAELLTMMLSLASATEGKAMLNLGAGEVRQTKPFGYKRSEGLGRLEDAFKLFRQLLSAEEPIDFEGNFWKYQQAWIGAGKTHLPKLVALGGGPRLFDVATKYADGLCSCAPCVFPTPEQWSTTVPRLRDDLERNGRDPDDFTYGLWFVSAVHEDPEVIQKTLDNPIVKYVAANFGRFRHADWEAEGIDFVLPSNFHYAMHMLPSLTTREEAESIVAKVSPEMARRSYIHGSPKEVAAVMQSYIDAGANWVQLSDVINVAGAVPLEQAPQQLGRALDVLRILKR